MSKQDRAELIGESSALSYYIFSILISVGLIQVTLILSPISALI